MINLKKKFVAVVLFGIVLSACSTEEQAVIQLEAVGCDAAIKRCTVDVEGKLVALTLQTGLVPLKPFSVLVEMEGGKVVETAIIDFQMVGMDMGINRYRLLREGSGLNGTATLPVCTTSRTDWMANIEYESNGKNYRIGFPFTTQ